MLYVLAGVIGFVVAFLFIKRTDNVEKMIRHDLKLGKRILIASNNQGVVMEMVDGQLVHTPIILDLELTKGDDTDVETVDTSHHH